MPRTADLQEALIQQILDRYAKKPEAVRELTEVLSLNRDGIYRRLRGDTVLTAAEIQKLAIHFDISIDAILTGVSNKTFFSYNAYQHQIASFREYLEQVDEQVKRFRDLPDLHMYYASREIPVFHFMMFPRLLAFKLYLFGLTAWRFDYLRDRKFSLDLVPPQDMDLARTIGRNYCMVNSSELWTYSILEHSLNQIEYVAAEDRFENKEASLEICGEVRHFVQHARAMAEAGRKFMPGQSPQEQSAHFNLFYNELASTGNTILGVAGPVRVLFNVFDSPNYLFTTDHRICRSTEEWFEEVLHHSIPISVHAGKNRNQYFNRLEQKIRQAEQRLELVFSSL